MKFYTILALVVAISGIFLTSSRSEDTSPVDGIKKFSPKNDLTYPESDEDKVDAFENKEISSEEEEDDDDDDDENREEDTDEVSDSNSLAKSETAVKSAEVASNAADEPGQFKRFWGRRRRRRRGLFRRIKDKVRKAIRKVRKVIGKVKKIKDKVKNKLKKVCKFLKKRRKGRKVGRRVCKLVRGDEENTPLAMDEERPGTVLHEFEEDLTESDYATIQKDQTGELN